MEQKPLILIGGGGHCKSVINAARSAGIPIRGILDAPELVGQRVLDVDIIGTDDDIPCFVHDCEFIITVGFVSSPALRIKLASLVEEAGGQFGIVIGSGANVSPWASIGAGTVVLQGACINADARIGRNCIINTLANIEHDAIVGENCHISTGAMVNGAVTIGNNCFIGSGCVIYHGMTITDNVVLSAGITLHKRLSQPGIYAGTPLRRFNSLV